MPGYSRSDRPTVREAETDSGCARERESLWYRFRVARSAPIRGGQGNTRYAASTARAPGRFRQDSVTHKRRNGNGALATGALPVARQSRTRTHNGARYIPKSPLFPGTGRWCGRFPFAFNREFNRARNTPSNVKKWSDIRTEWKRRAKHKTTLNRIRQGRWAESLAGDRESVRNLVRVP